MGRYDYIRREGDGEGEGHVKCVGGEGVVCVPRGETTRSDQKENTQCICLLSEENHEIIYKSGDIVDIMDLSNNDTKRQQRDITSCCCVQQKLTNNPGYSDIVHSSHYVGRLVSPQQPKSRFSNRSCTHPNCLPSIHIHKRLGIH